VREDPLAAPLHLQAVALQLALDRSQPLPVGQLVGSHPAAVEALLLEHPVVVGAAEGRSAARGEQHELAQLSLIAQAPGDQAQRHAGAESGGAQQLHAASLRAPQQQGQEQQRQGEDREGARQDQESEAQTQAEPRQQRPAPQLALGAEKQRQCQERDEQVLAGEQGGEVNVRGIQGQQHRGDAPGALVRQQAAGSIGPVHGEAAEQAQREIGREVALGAQRVDAGKEQRKTRRAEGRRLAVDHEALSGGEAARHLVVVHAVLPHLEAVELGRVAQGEHGRQANEQAADEQQQQESGSRNAGQHPSIIGWRCGPAQVLAGFDRLR